MKNSNKKNLKSLLKYIFERSLYTPFGKLIPNKIYLKIQYRLIMGHKLNLLSPQKYSEKIQYLKIHHMDDRLSKLVDKFTVREYIIDKIGPKYLIPLYDKYKSTSAINLSNLPSKFVLKCNHDSKSSIICWDKDNFDFKEAFTFLNKKLKKSAYNYSREYYYKNIERYILCEKLIGDGVKTPNDYKIMCFNGKAIFIIVDYDRFTGHKRDFFDLQWNRLNIGTDCPQSTYTHDKPTNLNEMISVAEKLSQDFKHVRVDLYNYDNQVYFGELTFMPWAGMISFSPNTINYELGDLINLE